MKTLLMMMLLILLVGVGQTSAQCPTPSWGSLYQQPYRGLTVGQPRYTGSYQSLPGGQQVYSAPVHSLYLGYYGRYSPTPILPRR